MRLSAVGFLLGILTFQHLAELPSWQWLFVIVMIIPALVVAPNYRFAWFAGLGICWSLLYAHIQLADQLDPNIEVHDLLATGIIASLPQDNQTSTKFKFTINKLLKIERDDDNKSFVSDSINNYPSQVLLNWYNDAPKLQAGQTWRLLIRLKKPHGFRNPGGFDYEAWLFRQGVQATGYVKSFKSLTTQLLAENEQPLKVNQLLIDSATSHWLTRLRNNIRSRIHAALEDSQFVGIITALTIGDRQKITLDQWNVLTLTGTNHLMAISGLHIGMVAGLFFLLGRKLWAYFPGAVLRLPAVKAGAITGLFAAFTYASLAGFAIPTQRALAMVALVMLSLLFQRNIQPSHTLSLALLLVLIMEPSAVLDSGFWLSFGAVAVILYGVVGRVGAGGIWWKWGRSQWLVFIGLSPLLLVFFQQIPLYSPIANIVAIPYMSVVTVPLSLLGALFVTVFPSLGDLLLSFANASLLVLWPFLYWLATMPQPEILLRDPPGWTLIPALIGIFWLLAPQGIPARWLGVIWLMPLIWLKPVEMREGQAKFTLLDVGQGLAAVIQTKNHSLVYDVGPRFKSGFDTGRSVVAPFLRTQGIAQIDRLVVSHGDNDHIGGAESLMELIPVKRVYTSVVHKFSVNVAKPCVDNERWLWDGVSFSFIHPGVDQLLSEHNDNNLSCVLMVETGSSRVLLTGDIEKLAEQQLLIKAKKRSIDLQADILVVPHHGSKTSSTKLFIDTVKPEYALAAVGYQNRFGFPKPEVVERYLQKSALFLDTANSGAISFTLDESQIELRDLFRQSSKRYWHSDLREK